jgi:class III poly(R)-hydroxyalkanoic acid synthase PhaE subunit
MFNDWVATQRKYWETWSDFARKAGGMFGQAEPAAANPFAAFGAPAFNPFAQGAFAQNPFGQNPFAQNPFNQNPFAAQGAATNPFAAFASAGNPFDAAMQQWWSAMKPQLQGELGTVAQRFYDMGKTFMSMAEGVFGAAGQEQPDAAMQMWMSSMQAALQQWIAQIQNNMDVATPDLPGISGTTLSTWAQFADSVSPWLNMSQNFLRDVAEGHLPGGIEMPGVGAAQEQFCRALSMPGLGYTREQQERMQELARHLIAYHDALRAYKIAFAKTALSSLDVVQKRLAKLHEEGKKIESLRALYDMWVDASEEAYAGFAMSDEYQVVYADLVNTLMRVRQDMNDLAEQQYRLMNLPTRSEIDTVQRRQQENRRESRHLRREIEELRRQLDRRDAAAKAAPAATARPAKAPAQKPLPIESSEDDLTMIKGIGPKMMEKLYAQGIRNFASLAQMNRKFAEELDESLKTQGRILRDDWIGQAKKLLG